MEYFAAKVICIWLSVWAIRKKADIDYQLDWASRLFRWIMVVIGFVVARLPGTGFGYLRVAGLITGLAFFCWPNLAYYFMHFLGRNDVAQKVL